MTPNRASLAAAIARSHLLDDAALEGTYSAASLSWAQLEPGSFDVAFGVIDAFPLEVSFRRFNIGFKAEAEVAPGKTMIGVAADLSTRGRWFGAPIDHRNIAVTRSGIVLQTHGAGGFCQLTVDEPELQRRYPAAPDALALLEGVAGFSLASDPVYAERLRECIHHIFRMSREKRTRPAAPALPARTVEGTLIPLIAAATERLDSHAVVRTSALTRRLAAVRTCETFMSEHVDEPLTLLDLSQISGCVRAR